MALNWVEELVGQLYQTKGYLVVYDVYLPMPMGGHSDIDVVAIGNGRFRILNVLGGGCSKSSKIFAPPFFG